MILRCKILASPGHLDLHEMKKLIKKVNKNWFEGVVWKWYEGEYEPSYVQDDDVSVSTQ